MSACDRGGLRLATRGWELGWLPDETLYSLASRYHRLAGHASPAYIARILFGVVRRPSQHDLPAGLDYFVKVTEGALGQVGELVRYRTILPYYLPFRSEEVAANALACLRGDSIGSTKYRLGILTSRFGAHHPLKACPKCMDNDRDRHGVAYWHRLHQLPGVWVCNEHSVGLLQSSDKAAGSARYSWLLPQDVHLSEATRYRSALPPPTLRILAQLCAACEGLVSLPEGFRFEPSHLVETYRAELERRDFILGQQRRTRLRSASEGFCEFVADARLIPELAPLPGTPAEASSQIARLLRLPRTGTHPLRHLFLVLWLFGDWRNFCERYQWHAAHGTDDARSLDHVTFPSPGTLDERQKDERKQQFFSLITDKQLAVTTAGRMLGLDPSTAMAWAADAGVHTRHKGKSLTEERRRALVADLAAGAHKHDLASKYGVTTHTVSRVLRSEPGLQQRWTDSRAEGLRAEHRSRWLHLAEGIGKLGIKAMRGVEPALYAWLYRNDRAWFVTTNVPFAAPAKGNNSQIDWDERDRDLAHEVEVAALELSRVANGSTISLTLLVKAIPTLRRLLRRLDRLPLTRRVIERAVRPSATSRRRNLSL